MHKILNDLKEIKNLIFTGYIWMSNSSMPQLLEQDKYDFSTIQNNPFIIEAYLYAEKENISYSIRHIDGQYIITETTLSDSLDDYCSNYTYLANPKLGEHKKLKFIEYWESQKDPLCENMEVLKPAWTAFTGFEKGGNK